MVLKEPNSFRTVNPSRQESLVVNLGLAPIIIINNKEHYTYTWKESVEQKICFVLSLLTFTDPPLSLVHDHMHKHIGKCKSRVMYSCHVFVISAQTFKCMRHASWFWVSFKINFTEIVFVKKESVFFIVGSIGLDIISLYFYIF